VDGEAALAADAVARQDDERSNAAVLGEVVAAGK